jgi:hypothetical protein
LHATGLAWLLLHITFQLMSKAAAAPTLVSFLALSAW